MRCKNGKRGQALKVESKIKRLKKTNKEIIVQSVFKKNELYEFLSLPITRGVS